MQAAGGGYDREKLFFSRNELAGFISALRFLDGKLRSGEPVPQGLTVASLSGDVTFDASPCDGGLLLAVTTAARADRQAAFRRVAAAY